MNIKDLANENGFDRDDLENWLRKSEYNVYFGLIKNTVNDEDVPAILRDYRDELDRRSQAAKRRAQSEEEKRRAMASMLITSGFSFDGYRITKYSGYISGDDAIEVSRGREGIFQQATNVGDALMKSLTVIRRNALNELKEAAYDLGCNAVIGVDFDYITLDPETVNASGGTLYLPYVFGVTANGNAVIIEKEDASI